ncbi:hypothetical protein TNCV_2843821 [Trichonephila clavipes]|nr:hypothetical protein TNCV_2843821 [Trichonephila clavipes]
MSVSQKRKIRKEKEYNINSKYAKSNNFLISASSSSCASSSSSNARELDEQGQAHPGIHKRRICSGAFLWGANWTSKLFATIGFAYMVPHEKEIPATGARSLKIVRVHYFVRGGFVGYRSRASSKHLSLIFRSTGLDSSGVKKGLRCTCKIHVWVSGPTKDAD